MRSEPVRESNSRSRTRRAILDAALTVLSQRPGASLADIADAANVGRSTLHRYFPERAELVTAIAADAVEKMKQAVADAALDQGTPVEAMRRVVHVYFEFGPVLMFLLGEPQLDHKELIGGFDAADEPVRELITRGQAEGCFDAEVSAGWISRVLGWIVYAGIESVRDGEISRYGATETIIRTLENGLLSRK
jgi:TetR/AcrR family transcriptional regulator, repressor for lfrA